MTLLTLFSPILLPPMTGGGGGFISIPPPSGGRATPVHISMKYKRPASIQKTLSLGSSQWHSTSQKPVSYLFDQVVAPPATLLGNPVYCHVRIQGKPIALLTAWGTGHAPFGLPHPPHATGVWKVITTSSKLRVKGFPVARIGDATTCGHSVIKGHPKLLTV